MAIEEKWWPWKPSLFNQYRIRIANDLHLVQRHEHCNELRRQILLVEEDTTQILKKMPPIDFTQIDQKLNSYNTLSQTEQKRTLKEYNRVKNQLIHLTPKLLIGNAYLRARSHALPILQPPVNNKKKRKRLKLTIEQQWRKGIGDAYRRLQIQRDKDDISKPVNISIPIEPLPIANDYPLDEPSPFITENIIDEIKEHEFLPPFLPPPIDEIIIPFQTPPIACRSPRSDRLQLPVDDTIVKPHRLVNKTLGNISHMSFHIDPEQCSSPKSEDKNKKNKLKKLLLPPPPPPPPLFSSTAIFDTHAFFTQTNSKTKKQKKKIDISRQPVIMTTNDTHKKKTRTKKTSPYDFQDDENTTLSRSKGAKLIPDDMITARFAKNSHYQSHQTSMASIKSSKSQHPSNERERKKKKKNILGIGTSSPLTLSANLTLSPGRLSTDDKDDDYEIKSSISRRHTRTNKPKRTRVK